MIRISKSHPEMGFKLLRVMCLSIAILGTLSQAKPTDETIADTSTVAQITETVINPSTVIPLSGLNSDDIINTTVGDSTNNDAIKVTEPVLTETMATTTSASTASEPASDSSITTTTVGTVESSSKSSEIQETTHKALNATSEVVNKLSDQIRIILKHFQNPDEVALPGDKIIPDPMDVPDMAGSLGVAEGNFTNISVHEQSKFTLESVNTNLDDMQIYVSLRMKRLMILGNYTITGLLFDTSEGPFNVTLTDVLAEGTVYLAKDAEGRIYANKSVTNMVQQGLNAQFVNSSSMFVNLAATFLFLGIKPYVLTKVDEKICNDMNTRLNNIAFKLPPSPWSPVDLAILEGRKYVKKMGYDPLIIKNILKYDEQFFTVSIDRLTVNGLSRFTRVGNVTLLMENNNIEFGIRIMTGRLEGNIEWFYDFGKIGIRRNGSSTFTISRIQMFAVINQSVDIRKHPVLQSLDIETGPVAVKMDGEGSFDYIVEFVVMLLPKMIRHMVIDSLEIPIKYQIQEILNNVDVEKLVDDNLNDVDYYINNFTLN